MKTATLCARRARSRRNVPVERRGPSPERILRVEVRVEPLPAAQEERLAEVAALQRLAQVRHRLEAFRRWRAQVGQSRRETVC